MQLPRDFALSATAIETYIYCPRRFAQRYLLGIPTLDIDVVGTEAMHRGDLFHRLVLWDALGQPVDALLAYEADDQLVEQWRTYVAAKVELLPTGADIRHEHSLVIRIDGQRITGRLDALVINRPNGIMIYDWKSGESPDRDRGAPASGSGSVQSRIYPLLVWETLSADASAMLFDPGQISMVYWFPAFPDEPVRLRYSAEQLTTDRRWLAGIVAEILADVDFALTDDLRRCKRCGYAAHCGIAPLDGPSPELSEDDAWVIDIDDEQQFVDERM